MPPARSWPRPPAEPAGPARPLCLLLLDGVLEQVAFARRAEDLRRAPNVLVVEPARRTPAGMLVDRVAKRLAKRLPGIPRVIVLIGPVQYPLARALLTRHPDAELWYASRPGEEDPLARERATFVFSADDDPGVGAFQVNGELWDRLEALGVARR